MPATRIIPALLLPDGTPGDVLQTLAGGIVVWDAVSLAMLPIGIPGQQIFAAPGTGIAQWQRPLGHSEETSIVAGLRETDSTVVVGQSQVAFDPSTLVAPSGGLTRTITFEAVLWATFGMTAEVSLFNLTDNAVVAGTVLTTASIAPVRVASADLTVPAVLPDALRLYELRLRISAGVPGAADRAFISQARLRAVWS